jgi:selenide, water dikinase
MGPQALAQVLRPLAAQIAPPALLVGLNAADDAAVYRVNDQQAIISTADFFPPVVDDPYSFGAIAAANALSDIYAMGGQPLMAINLVAWPDDLDYDILSDILRGGAETVSQTGGVIAGGHTVTDREPKYGLAVTGIVHPEHILTKGGARSGDLLILSKPLGTGLITTALKRDLVEQDDLDAAVQSMMRLNREASRALQRLGSGVHAATDITGFGLLGHAWEMAAQSRAGMSFSFAALPLLPGARHYAEIGAFPGGTERNEEYLTSRVRIDAALGDVERVILFDPQTSGGLFAAIDPASWPRLVELAQDVPFWRVGTVTAQVEHEAEVFLEVHE